ncbi:MAG: hypothetical protein JKY37_23610 [Nannocystaceae bacterium]|nr:hypothetical protein [Nannocystaceae bacterium]
MHRTSPKCESNQMPARKQFQSTLVADPELAGLLEAAKSQKVPEEILREQRISFAFGNAPRDSDLITKDSVRYASEHLQIK